MHSNWSKIRGSFVKAKFTLKNITTKLGPMVVTGKLIADPIHVRGIEENELPLSQTLYNLMYRKLDDIQVVARTEISLSLFKTKRHLSSGSISCKKKEINSKVIRYIPLWITGLVEEMQREREREEWKVCLIVIKKREGLLFTDIFSNKDWRGISCTDISLYVIIYIFIYIYSLCILSTNRLLPRLRLRLRLHLPLPIYTNDMKKTWVLCTFGA